jgi:NAD(P)-dependent dehydrogenase (short-subunit alcohol dehydrogenase family)
MDLFDIAGRNYVVTGSGHGLGRAIALELARRSARIVVCARTEGEIATVADEIRDGGGTAYPIAFDAANPASCHALIAAAEERLGPLDGLVLNHGVGHGRAIVDLTDEEFAQILDVNLKGCFTCARAFGKALIGARKLGSIVLVSSTAAVSTFDNLTAYGVSKTAATQLMKQLAVEWGRHNIRANAIAPGYLTHMMKGTADRYMGTDVDTWVEKMTPMRRRGDLSEMVGAVLYFLSDAASFTTGQVLSIDGGYTLV